MEVRSVAVLKILKLNNDKLRELSSEVKLIDAEIIKIFDDLVDTCLAAGGLAIAAPQVGIMKRMIVVLREDGNHLKLINPQIIKAEGEQIFLEACLSVDTESEFFGAFVKRPNQVLVKGINENNEEVEVRAEGLDSIVLCHEIDHLDGVLFLDKVEGEILKFTSSEDCAIFRHKYPLQVLKVNNISI
jgi:peptide deformylase